MAIINPPPIDIDEALGVLFARLPTKVRIAGQTVYDVGDLGRVALVCKKWQSVCYSRKEWAPYIDLFRRQFSKVAPFPTRDGECIPRLYLHVVTRCLGSPISSIKALRHAVKNDYELAVRDLVKKVANINEIKYIDLAKTLPTRYEFTVDRGLIRDLGTPLACGIKHASVRSVAILLEQKNIECESIADSAEDGRNEALSFAISEDISTNPQRQEIVRLLLAHEKVEIYDIFDRRGHFGDGILAEIGQLFSDLIATKKPMALRQLLEAAVACKNMDAIKAIVTSIKKLGFDTFGNHFFHLLCLAGDEALQYHLPNIVDPNWKDESGKTLLDIAIERLDMKMIDLLLSNPRVELSPHDFQGPKQLGKVVGVLGKVLPASDFSSFLDLLQLVFQNHTTSPDEVQQIARQLIAQVAKLATPTPTYRSQTYQLIICLKAQEELEKKFGPLSATVVPETTLPTEVDLLEEAIRRMDTKIIVFLLEYAFKAQPKPGKVVEVLCKVLQQHYLDEKVISLPFNPAQVYNCIGLVLENHTASREELLEIRAKLVEAVHQASLELPVSPFIRASLDALTRSIEQIVQQVAFQKFGPLPGSTYPRL